MYTVFYSFIPKQLKKSYFFYICFIIAHYSLLNVPHQISMKLIVNLIFRINIIYLILYLPAKI